MSNVTSSYNSQIFTENQFSAQQRARYHRDTVSKDFTLKSGHTDAKRDEWPT